MLTQESFETLVQHSLRGLCTTCVHADECSYRKGTSKKIIQCELYTSDEQNKIVIPEPHVRLRGLCVSCTMASVCRLPGKQTGAFHCKEYV